MEIQQLKKALENELDKLKGHIRLDINLEKSRAIEAVRIHYRLPVVSLKFIVIRLFSIIRR